ncbi:MAG: class I SAM-dependent methyltransferase [Anaerolineales bacterium]
MAEQTVSRTALGAAICRLIEQYQPEKIRLFCDPVAGELVGGPLRFLMRFASMRNLTMKQTDAVAKGIYGTQICRTRYIDEAVLAAVSQRIKQLVILGAGFDTRPYRFPEIKSVKVFEVDLPAVQEDKKKKLQRYLGQLPDNVTFIGMDFDTQSLEAVFSEAAWDASEPAVFIWEAVTQYVSEEGVRRTLAFVGKSPPGSILLFTYVLKSIIEWRSDIPDANRLMDVVARQSPWVFGLEPSGILEFLRPHHLVPTADVGNAYYQEKYLQPVGRALIVFQGERVVQAVVS